jgi:hypothetical protein
MFHFIPEISHFHTTKSMLKNLLGNRTVNVLFTNGGHFYGGVKIDYEIHTKFLAPDCLPTLHDMQLRPENWGTDNEDSVFWNEITANLETLEIIDSNGVCRLHRLDRIESCWDIGILGIRNNSG